MQCSECGGCDVVEDRQTGDCVCQGCGLVLEDHAWDFNTHDLSAPLPNETLTHQVIANCPRKLMHAGNHSSRLRTLATSSSELRWMAGQLTLPDNVLHSALDMWERVHAHHVCRGEMRRALEATCLYFACKLAGFPRPKDLLARAFGLDLAVLNKAFKTYMGIVQPTGKDAALMANPTESRDILASCVAAAVGLIPDELQRVVLADARKVDEAIHRTGVLEGKTPKVKAAAAISIAMRRRRLMGRNVLWESVGVSEYTLSRTLVMLRMHTSVR